MFSPQIENKPLSVNEGNISGYSKLTIAWGPYFKPFPLPLQIKVVKTKARFFWRGGCRPTGHIHPTHRNYSFVIKTAVKLGDRTEVAAAVVVAAFLLAHNQSRTANGH